MRAEAQVVDIELCKALKAQGIAQVSLFYWNVSDGKLYIKVGDEYVPVGGKIIVKVIGAEYVSAWTMAELMNMSPHLAGVYKGIGRNTQTNRTEIVFNATRTIVEKERDEHGKKLPGPRVQYTAGTPADALALMIVEAIKKGIVNAALLNRLVVPAPPPSPVGQTLMRRK